MRRKFFKLTHRTGFMIFIPLSGAISILYSYFVGTYTFNWYFLHFLTFIPLFYFVRNNIEWIDKKDM
ncbi:hypothetical protein ASG39_12780 [Rhizobium sp. Leaf371]|nr:hypothetical protein ASG39_12780 [Rhizobium sp. Leaf371]